VDGFSPLHKGENGRRKGEQRQGRKAVFRQIGASSAVSLTAYPHADEAKDPHAGMQRTSSSCMMNVHAYG
jgi:hypothetical protein